jgi:hypothetical protein
VDGRPRLAPTLPLRTARSPSTRRVLRGAPATWTRAGGESVWWKRAFRPATRLIFVVRRQGVGSSRSRPHAGREWGRRAPPTVRTSVGTAIGLRRLREFSGLRDAHHAARRQLYCKTLTARAMTSATVTTETADWVSIVNLAHLVIGMVSVGLKAVAFVNETYR